MEDKEWRPKCGLLPFLALSNTGNYLSRMLVCRTILAEKEKRHRARNKTMTTNLSDSDKIIACAEACGFKNVKLRECGNARSVTHIIKGKKSHHAVPRYLSDPAAALTLCDEALKRGWFVDIDNAEDGWCVMFTNYDNSMLFTTATHANLATAITDAFLETL